MELKRTRDMARDAELSELFARIEQTPKQHTVKGMYVGGIWEALGEHGVTTPMPRIQKFKDYPVTDYMELSLDAAATLFPSRPLLDGLQALGRLAIPTFASSIVGAVIMGSVGHHWGLALKWVSKGYEVSLKPGTARVVQAGPQRAVLELRDVWNFAETYHAGVVEGLLDWCDVKGTVSPKVLSGGDTDLHIDWSTGDTYESSKPKSDAPSPTLS